MPIRTVPINVTTGYVMRPLTDKFKIPRVKLAFLVHSLSAPLVILAPISSWVAMITGQLDQAGVGINNNAHVKVIGDPFFIYITSIPFIFYSFLMILSAWLIVHRRLSYGPMHTHELVAQKTGNLFGGKKAPADKIKHTENMQGSLTDLLVPLVTLIGTVLIGIAYTGGYYLLGGTRTLLDAFKNNTESALVLFAAGLITVVVSFIFALLRNKIKITATHSVVRDGVSLMISPVIMVFLAATLGVVLRQDLLTGHYLASLLLGSVSISMLPFMFFIVSVITATMTGSSWGTIALMLPIAIPMLTSFLSLATPTTPEQILILFPVLGAIFSGSVCGDHISPISETTIMAATSSGSYPLDHAHTQFPYAAPAIISSGIAFLASGFLTSYPLWINLIISLSLGTIICFGLLYALDSIKRR